MMHHDALETPSAGQALVNASVVRRGKTKETGEVAHAAFLEKSPYADFTTEELQQVGND